MNSNVESRPVQPHFGAFILETLTMGMYGESRNAIREYVQNCFDSVQQAVRDKLITADAVRVEVTLDTAASMMVMRDNGVGLTSTSAVAVLVSVGASKKNFRKNAGFRGIGRLAGIVFCDELRFTTKAKGESKITTVVFDAKKLRELLEPSRSHEDAASTLMSCITAYTEDASNVDEHFFEVRLTGFHQPPKECEDIGALKSFLSQVSPLPYSKQFSHAEEICKLAEAQGKEIETIRLFVRAGDSEYDELFKPYGDKYSVKRVQAPLTDIDPVQSATGRWWGWIGRKRVSGAIKDADTRGIRVRARNIQIDGIEVMREIFARSYEEEKPRLSYARFAEWYVGEIFIESGAAVPNARRDGFEEDEKWISLRKELGDAVGDKYGRLAYRVSASEQISLPKLTARLAELESNARRLIADGTADWDLISPVTEEAKELQRRILKASAIADDDEGKALYALSTKLGTLRYDVSRIAGQAPRSTNCQVEVAEAKLELVQKIFSALRDGLGPAEWNRASAIVQQVSGEEPD